MSSKNNLFLVDTYSITFEFYFFLLKLLLEVSVRDTYSISKSTSTIIIYILLKVTSKAVEDF